MTEKIRFDSSFRGYNKGQVDEYIKGLIGDYDSLKSVHDEVFRKKTEIEADRDKIAKTLIRAQEKAESIVSEAEIEAMAKKKKVDEEISANKEVLAKLKEELENYRNRILDLLQNFDEERILQGSSEASEFGKEQKEMQIDFEKIDNDFKIDDDFESI